MPTQPEKNPMGSDKQNPDQVKWGQQPGKDQQDSAHLRDTSKKPNNMNNSK